jgi:hypothetical protein
VSSILDRLNTADQKQANEQEAKRQGEEQERQRLAQILQAITSDQNFMEAAADEVIESFIRAYENYNGFGKLQEHWFSLRPRFGRDFLNGADSQLDNLPATLQYPLMEAIARLVSEKIANTGREAVCLKDGNDKPLTIKLEDESMEEYKIRHKRIQDEADVARQKWPWIIVVRPKKT